MAAKKGLMVLGTLFNIQASVALRLPCSTHALAEREGAGIGNRQELE